MRSHARRFAIVLVSLAALPSRTAAERLPIKAYTAVEGLAHNTVNRIVRDSRGFLWFATDDGLSRFDGYTFTNFSVEHGLPHRTVTQLLETREGELWVATLGGLVRFDPWGTASRRVVSAKDPDAHRTMFTVIVPDDPDPRAAAALSLLEGHDGTIWCGTRKGLYRLQRHAMSFALAPVDVGMPNDPPLGRYVNDLSFSTGKNSATLLGDRAACSDVECISIRHQRVHAVHGDEFLRKGERRAVMLGW